MEERQWITHDEFMESFAIGQMTPGPPIVNTGICIGYKLRRLGGALSATVGQAFTGTVLAILLAAFYLHMKDNPLLQAVMKGVGAAVVGLLGSIIYKMATKMITDYRSVLLALAAFWPWRFQGQPRGHYFGGRGAGAGAVLEGRRRTFCGWPPCFLWPTP